MSEDSQQWLDRRQAATALGVSTDQVAALAANPECPLPRGVKRDGRSYFYPLRGCESVESARKWMLEMDGAVENYAPLTGDRLRDIGLRQMTSSRARPDALAEIKMKLAKIKSQRHDPPRPARRQLMDERDIALEIAAAMRSALARCAPELGEDPKALEAMRSWVGQFAKVVVGLKRTRHYVR